VAGVLLFPALTATLPARQFVSGVSAVEVYASVTDGRGDPIQGLKQADFEVRENGELQVISTFAEADFPLSVALGLDRSFSMRGDRLAMVKAGARSFLDALRPQDESMVVAIGSEVDIVAPLAPNGREQRAALERLDAFGTTGLFDAVVTSIDAVQPAKGRRALVLLSDGDDRYSRTTAAEALERARQSDVMVYAVALGRIRPPLFAELSTVTGGRSFHVKDSKSLDESLRGIATELPRQYLLGYTPSRPVTPGTPDWRSIEVRVRQPDARVRARDGYVAR